MSNQGDAEQWRPASRHSEQHSTPDDTTGPLPAVSGDEGAAPGFPPPGGRPGAWSEDGATAGAFPSVPPAAEPPSSASPPGRAPFEPADPSGGARSYAPQDSATDDSWRRFEHVTE